MIVSLKILRLKPERKLQLNTDASELDANRARRMTDNDVDGDNS